MNKEKLEDAGYKVISIPDTSHLKEACDEMEEGVKRFDYKKWQRRQRYGCVRIAMLVTSSWVKKFMRILWRTMKENKYILLMLLALFSVPFVIAHGISIINACRWALTSIGAFITGCGIDTFMTIRGGQHETNN